MTADGTNKHETVCRVCCEPMQGEKGNTHSECHEDAKEEFVWYP